MIFVTVGTHEQQFNRLIQEIDRLKGEGEIEDEVVMQTGFSTYIPKHCKWSKLISFKEMNSNIEQAGIVITHGGPASFISVMQAGKIPLVVPRQKKFGEHVNDHQLEFCRAVEKRIGNIIVVENIENLKIVISEYEERKENMGTFPGGNNRKFNEGLELLVREIMDR